jgi:hypothetical protein
MRFPARFRIVCLAVLSAAFLTKAEALAKADPQDCAPAALAKLGPMPPPPGRACAVRDPFSVSAAIVLASTNPTTVSACRLHRIVKQQTVPN